VLDESNTSHRLVRQFVDALGSLPNIQVEAVRWDARGSNFAPDAEVDLRILDKLVRLNIEARTVLYPRDAREVLWRLQPYGELSLQNAGVSVLVADSISPGAKEFLKEQHIGYYDSGGSMYLPASGAYVYIDKPPPKAFAQSLGSLYSGVRAQVLHALLHQYQEWIGGQELAARAQVSTATASQVLMELERLEFVQSRGQGPHKERHVTQPGALLDSWVKHLALKRAPSVRRYFVPSLKAETWEPLVQVFAARRVEYAISYEAAAQHYAPFISSVSQLRMKALVGSATDAALTAMNAHEVGEGANLAIIDAKSTGEFLFRKQADGLWWANPVQVYLDLQRGEGRSKEMAEHLRREKIGF
jgi:hypothetical protein